MRKLIMVVNFIITIKYQFLTSVLLMDFCIKETPMKDFIFTEDLKIENGDFAIGESDNQQVKFILQAQKGEFKANPEVGVGIEKMLHTDNPMEFLIEAKKNLEYDGMKVKNIAFTNNGTIDVDAKYIVNNG